MQSRTIEFDFKSYLVEVEVDREMHVIRAEMEVEFIGSVRFDCTEAFRNSSFCMKELEEKFQGLDWDDHGDDEFAMESLEVIREALRPA